MKRGHLSALVESYLMLYRVTMFRDEARGANYTDATWPVLRLLAPDDFPKTPAPVPEQLPKGTGTDESAFVAPLGDLEAGTKDWWGRKGFKMTESLELGPIDIEGIDDCVPNHTSCGGDNRDAA